MSGLRAISWSARDTKVVESGRTQLQARGQEGVGTGGGVGGGGVEGVRHVEGGGGEVGSGRLVI